LNLESAGDEGLGQLSERNSYGTLRRSGAGGEEEQTKTRPTLWGFMFLCKRPNVKGESGVGEGKGEHVPSQTREREGAERICAAAVAWILTSKRCRGENCGRSGAMECGEVHKGRGDFSPPTKKSN